MDTRRQCGSCFATGHNHRKVIGWTPFVQVSTTQAFSCPETVNQRPCNNNGPRDTPKLCLTPEGFRPPPNKWSLAPRRVHAPNGSLSVSAISVVLTVVTSWHTHAQNSTFPVLHRHKEQQWLQAASYALHKWHRHVDTEKINHLPMDPTSEIKTALLISMAIRNKSAPIQLAQCRLLAMAISNAKILIYFFYNTPKRFHQTALRNCYGLKLPKCQLQYKKKFYCVIYYNFRQTFVPHESWTTVQLVRQRSEHIVNQLQQLMTLVNHMNVKVMEQGFTSQLTQNGSYRRRSSQPNDPFTGTTRVSWYQKGKTNLDFTEATDSEWQWHQLDHMRLHLAPDR